MKMLRRKHFILIFLVLACLFYSCSVVVGHPTYVPTSVCQSMLPHHKREAERDECPFKVITYSDKIQPGKSILISLVVDDEEFTSWPWDGRSKTLKSKGRRVYRGEKEKKGFKGFYVQARESRENLPVGRFTPKEDESVKVHSCGSGTDNAAFHGVKGHKTNVTIEWTAPEDFQGKIIFTTTFVKKYHKFWTHVKSSPVSVRISYNNGF